jgi:hypothetical protein
VPSAGPHDAVICSCDVRFGRTIDLILEYRLQENGEDFRLRETLPIDAPRDSWAYPKTAQGKGRLLAILKFFGERAPEQIDHAAIARLVVGRGVQIVVAHNITEGLASPVVTAVIGRARNPVPPPVSGQGA